MGGHPTALLSSSKLTAGDSMRYLTTAIFLTLQIQSFQLYADQGWGGDIDLNFGYNDNVYLQHNDIDIRDEENSGNKDVQRQINLSAYTKFYDGKKGDAKLLVNYFYENLAENELTTSIFSISLPLSSYSKANRLRIIPTYSSYNIDGKDALDSFGSKIDLTNKINRYKFGISYQHTVKSALSTDYRNSEGNNTKLSLNHTGNWLNKSYSLSFGRYENGYQQTEDGNSTHSGNFISGSYFHYHKGFSIQLYAITKTKEYTEDTATDFIRSDTNTLVSATPTYRLTKNTSVYTHLQWIKNRSNLNDDTDNMNYVQKVYSVGFRYFFG